MSMMGINLIWDNIILFAARGVMMHFQSGPQDHLATPAVKGSLAARIELGWGSARCFYC